MRCFSYILAGLLFALCFNVGDCEAGRGRRSRSCAAPSVSNTPAPAPYAPAVVPLGSKASEDEYETVMQCNGRYCVPVRRLKTKPATKAATVEPVTSKPAERPKSTSVKYVQNLDGDIWREDTKIVVDEGRIAINDSVRRAGEYLKRTFSSALSFAASLPKDTHQERSDNLPDAPAFVNIQVSDSPSP